MFHSGDKTDNGEGGLYAEWEWHGGAMGGVVVTKPAAAILHLYKIPSSFVPVGGMNVIGVQQALRGLVSLRASLPPGGDHPAMRALSIQPKSGRWKDAKLPALFPHQKFAYGAFMSGQHCTSADRPVESGILHARCGFGKTLVVGHILSHLCGAALIVVPSSIAQDQWLRHLSAWGVSCRKVEGRMVSFNTVSAVVVTYSMISSRTRHSESMRRDLDTVLAVYYSALVLDEAHLVPAPIFRLTCKNVTRDVTIALTATMSRTDGRICDLPLLVGGNVLFSSEKSGDDHMFSATNASSSSALSLERRVLEVPLCDSMLSAWNAATGPKKQVVVILNPNKMSLLIQILSEHKDKKCIVFCDWTRVIHCICHVLDSDVRVGCVYGPLSGSSSSTSRANVLESFARAEGGGVLLLTSVGEVALDIPSLEVVVELTSNRSGAASKQRVGRVLRHVEGKMTAFSYVLLTSGASEVQVVEERDSVRAEKVMPFCNLTAYQEEMISSSIDHELSRVKRSDISSTSSSRGHKSRAAHVLLRKRIGVQSNSKPGSMC
jgi:superfamily II DNA or RNA helicase